MSGRDGAEIVDQVADFVDRHLQRAAQVHGLAEHDLRHEATCRWFELRRPGGGGWVFSDIEICRIMGWSDPKMALVYASLRGEDLAARIGAA